MEIITGHVGFCGPTTIINNPLYFLFTASADQVTIAIEVGACSGGNAASQAAIIQIVDTCNQWTNQDVIVCDPGKPTGGTMLLDFVAVPGQEYFLLIDGSNGAFCDYEISMASGVSCVIPDGDLVSIAGDQDLCQSEQGYMVEVASTINSYVNYVWDLPWLVSEKVITEDPVLYFDMPENTPLGPHVICVFASSGCDVSDTELCLDINIHPKPVINLPPDTIWCMFEPMELNAGEEFATYLWSTGDTTASIFVNELGSYSVTITDQNGCLETASVEVIQSTPLPTILSEDYICNNTPVTLTIDTLGLEYLWSSGDTDSVLVVEQPGVYCVTITYADCQQSVCKEILPVESQAMITDTAGSTNLCHEPVSGLVFEFTGSLPPFFFRYEIGGMEMLTADWSVGPFFMPFPHKSGDIKVYFLGNEMCEVEHLIFEGTLEFSDIYIDTLFISPFDTMDIAEIIIIPGGGQAPYQFTFSTGVQDSVGYFQIDEAGEYCVTITDQLGCETDTCFNVTGSSSLTDQQPESFNVYPNPFSNQIWFDGLDSDPAEAFLYDFTGKLLFHKKLIPGEPLNMTGYAPGTYLLKIVNKKGKNSIHRIVKVE